MIYAFMTTIGAYFIGSLNASLVLARLGLAGDIRRQGSGNAGATNMYRVHGWPLAASVFALDALKGWAVVSASPTPWAALAVLAGHCFPIFFQGKGGKGVATSLGILFAIEPRLALVALIIWLAVVGGCRAVALGSLAGMLGAMLASLIWSPSWSVTLTLMGILLTWQHRSNLKRLRQGQELTV